MLLSCGEYRIMIPRILTITVIAAAALLLYSYASGFGYLGEPQARGQIHQQPLPEAVTANAQQQRQSAAAMIGASSDKQVLFGDLHVHTTWSNDAYFASLPGQGTGTEHRQGGGINRPEPGQSQRDNNNENQQ